MSLLLSARGLSKAYVAGFGRCWVRVQVLASLSLSLRAGERVLVIGAPGSGKTTLLHCLVGLRRLDAGAIRWDAARGAPYGVCRRPADLARATHWRSGLAELPDDDDGAAAWRDTLGAIHGGDAGWLVLARCAGALTPLAHRILELRDGSLHPRHAPARLAQVAESRALAPAWRERPAATAPGIRD